MQNKEDEVKKINWKKILLKIRKKYKWNLMNKWHQNYLRYLLNSGNKKYEYLNSLLG